MLSLIISLASAADVRVESRPGNVVVQPFDPKSFLAPYTKRQNTVWLNTPQGKALLDSKVKKAQLPLTANFGQDCLKTHNIFRSMLNLPGYTWSDSLASSAQAWANYLAAANVLQPSGRGLGENLFMSYGADLGCANAVRQWFSGFQSYNGELIPQGNFMAYGSFTQVAWPKTTQVGCATAKVPTQFGPRQSVVCQYSPPGNIQGAGVSYVIAA